MTAKEKILKAIQEMPQDVTFDELMKRLNLLYQGEQGHQEVKQKLQEGAIKRAKRDLELTQE